MSIKLVIPKGRIYNKVSVLLEEMGIKLSGTERNYRPTANDPNLEVKLLKSQNVPTLLELGQHDIGFAGLDWVQEQNCDVEMLMDLKFDPVKIVVAIPEQWDWQEVQSRKFIAVTEYMELAKQYLDAKALNYKLVRAYGATEVFPPEDGDVVIDNTSTGSTLVANNLKIVDVVMESSTYFMANKEALKDPVKKAYIDNMMLLMKGVLDGRNRVLLEMNCSQDKIDTLIKLLPAMRSPTVAELYQGDGYAVKAAVDKNKTKDLIPKLIEAGATDILEMPIRKVL